MEEQPKKPQETEKEEAVEQQSAPQPPKKTEPPSPEEQVAELKQKNLLLLAEMENLRKRLLKEKIEMNRFAIENILSEILSPLDNFENALGFTDGMSAETKTWAVGFEMILGQLKEILSHHNVRPFVSLGKEFDPHKHEAVEIEETTAVPEGTITHEFVKGYHSGDRILRVARVKVAKAPSQENKN